MTESSTRQGGGVEKTDRSPVPERMRRRMVQDICHIVTTARKSWQIKHARKTLAGH
ncbi:hypothetical protein [Thalassobius sp. Cn5-15]|uniref:hypothetical protein n=1 Tax=Thalassobius sp. Cn5-15 TaxID=2917763 RepID=UPI001EF36ACF|nr:hypothetical protein [Thalassobius sp. Cn5-15]MCG7494600.1 hypothetical protein [Thalassobius sp. Cn5-15]